MIYTVTLNPSLDYGVTLTQLTTGMVNRTCKESLCCGGKGINVSIMLRRLGLDSTIFGFTAGFTGDAIASFLQQEGCRTDFIRLEQGMSRINVKIKADEETEINGRGPQTTPEELEALFHKLDRLTAGDILVLAGSLSPSLPTDIYEQILKELNGRKIKVVLDTTGDSLRNALTYQPFLIKPNHHELGELFDTIITTKEEAVRYARELQKVGACNVLVSMAKDGAVLVCKNGSVYQCSAPKGTVVSAVGAGDSMVAGFLFGYLAHNSLQEGFKMGIAAGSATAFSEGLADHTTVLHLYNSI